MLQIPHSLFSSYFLSLQYSLPPCLYNISSSVAIIQQGERLLSSLPCPRASHYPPPPIPSNFIIPYLSFPLPPLSSLLPLLPSIIASPVVTLSVIQLIPEGIVDFRKRDEKREKSRHGDRFTLGEETIVILFLSVFTQIFGSSNEFSMFLSLFPPIFTLVYWKMVKKP